VKIFDLETGVEEPHVTILRRTSRWRISLRTRQSLDEQPPLREVPAAVLKAVDEGWRRLIVEWDRIHPTNPVASDD